MKYRVTWIEMERAGVVVEADSKAEAVELAQTLGEDSPEALEWFDRVAIGRNRFQVEIER